MTDIQKLLTPPVVKKIIATNQKNLKAVESGGTVEYQVLRQLLLIGKHTYPEGKAVLAALDERNDVSAGKLEVHRAAIIGKGDIKAIPAPRNRKEFEDAIKLISKKKVYYA